MVFESYDRFQDRHIGPDPHDRREMLEVVRASSLDSLIDEAIPANIRLDRPLDLPEGESEYEFLRRLRDIASENRLYRSFIGMGYYGCVTPAVIVRNLLENPGWYTPYTPYQAEIAQGRLESLLNFQTMVHDLTGTEIANASLLDEATAAAEAMTMLHRIQSRSPNAPADRNTFLVSKRSFPQTVDVLHGRAEPLGLSLRLAEPTEMEFEPAVFGVLLQYPDDNGAMADLAPIITRAHKAGVLVAVASDLLSLTLFTPPGDMGADVIVGNAQRFGVPLGYGGPHAAFLATRSEYVRQAPGRIIGVSVDAHGNRAYRMALQTREQHIRRERATSNICTAQALLANISAMYAVYHGPEGLTSIARRVHACARALDGPLHTLGFTQLNTTYFDTLKVRVPDVLGGALRVQEEALHGRLNFRYFGDGQIGISLDETTSLEDVQAIANVFARVAGQASPSLDLPGARDESDIPSALRRRTPFLTHPVFNTHHSETEMMRYIRGLERKDIGLDRSMIPLGSCTMKLNAASEMLPITWPEFSTMHPFAPVDQAQGYARVVSGLEGALSRITGLPAVSLQPNSGAQGEFAGLMVIRAYHRDRGDVRRDIVLIPSSAHGTNPASAVTAGMRVVIVATDRHGNVDVDDLNAKATEHRDRLAALMITYPSTHGVFEDRIQEVCGVVHRHGGQVYMDGANMNAQVGLTSPAAIGADVCHLNLHKTFAIPHGGGGPGMGPIAVAEHLAPYLPGHPVIPVGGDKAIPAVSAAPWGSASILLISYAYIRLLGGAGMTDATRCAILNANYIKSRLEGHYDVLYTRPNGRVAHEMIFDLRGFKQAGIDEQDVAKRLMDYGFHAPTVSFPVSGTLMIEPTESEGKQELDRFCEAMVHIRKEIQGVVEGRTHPTDNVLKNAPHTAAHIAADTWSHPYSRTAAAFPLPWVQDAKFWPPVGRVDNPYGDRNLLCVCPAVSSYEDETVSSQ
jgi:glycine cleavage system P protein (glycine dehydrogenase)